RKAAMGQDAMAVLRAPQAGAVRTAMLHPVAHGRDNRLGGRETRRSESPCQSAHDPNSAAPSPATGLSGFISLGCQLRLPLRGKSRENQPEWSCRKLYAELCMVIGKEADVQWTHRTAGLYQGAGNARSDTSGSRGT